MQTFLSKLTSLRSKSHSIVLGAVSESTSSPSPSSPQGRLHQSQRQVLVLGAVGVHRRVRAGLHVRDTRGGERGPLNRVGACGRGTGVCGQAFMFETQEEVSAADCVCSSP